MKTIQNTKSYGFTLVEIIILVVVLAIVAVVALPMIGSASSMQIRSAGNKVAADLEYAKSMAISRQQYYSVVFDTANEKYQIQDSTGTVVEDIIRKGHDYIVDFTTDSRMSQVQIGSVDFDSEASITFDYLGTPYSGVGLTNSLVDGSDGITLTAGNSQVEIFVEPMTGYITIQ